MPCFRACHLILRLSEQFEQSSGRYCRRDSRCDIRSYGLSPISLYSLWGSSHGWEWGCNFRMREWWISEDSGRLECWPEFPRSTLNFAWLTDSFFHYSFRGLIKCALAAVKTKQSSFSPNSGRPKLGWWEMLFPLVFVVWALLTGHLKETLLCLLHLR